MSLHRSIAVPHLQLALFALRHRDAWHNGHYVFLCIYRLGRDIQHLDSGTRLALGTLIHECLPRLAKAIREDTARFPLDGRYISCLVRSGLQHLLDYYRQVPYKNHTEVLDGALADFERAANLPAYDQCFRQYRGPPPRPHLGFPVMGTCPDHHWWWSWEPRPGETAVEEGLARLNI